jgi:hypothetical protein
MRVVEMVRRTTECVDLQFGKQILGKLLEQPVQDKTTFDSALRMQDEDDFGKTRIVQVCLDSLVRFSYVGGCVTEVALYEALDNVKDDACCPVVNSLNWPFKGESQAVDVTHHPSLARRWQISCKYVGADT